MNPLYGEIRACIDSFVDDIARVVTEAIHDQVAIELDRLSLTSRGSSSIGRRKTRRSAAGNRPANGTKAEPRSNKRRGGRRVSDEQLELTLTDAATKSRKTAEEVEPPKPPPLFVHKRTREGKIHHLSRAAGNGDEEVKRQNGAANP